MNEISCCICGKSTGIAGEFPRPELGMYCWAAFCPKCGEQKVNQARQALHFSEALRDFMTATLSNPAMMIDMSLIEPANRKTISKNVAIKVGDYAQATLNEYIKRLDGRDSDTELFERLEWSGMRPHADVALFPCCPECSAFVNDPHGSECKLARRLGR